MAQVGRTLVGLVSGLGSVSVGLFVNSATTILQKVAESGSFAAACAALNLPGGPAIPVACIMGAMGLAAGANALHNRLEAKKAAEEFAAMAGQIDTIEQAVASLQSVLEKHQLVSTPLSPDELSSLGEALLTKDVTKVHDGVAQRIMLALDASGLATAAHLQEVERHVTKAWLTSLSIWEKLRGHEDWVKEADAELHAILAGIDKNAKSAAEDAAVLRRAWEQGGVQFRPATVTNFLALGLTRNPVFTGREAEMLALRAAMFPAASAGTQTTPHASALTQGFTGEGGIGKSQLAQRFAERACAALRETGESAEAGWDLFDCAWWLDCSKDGHGTAVRDLAEHLGYSPTPQDTPATLRAAIRTKFDRSKRHLVILDNLDELDAAAMAAQGEQSKWARAVEWKLPPGSALLFTTRSQNLPAKFGARVQLDVLSPDDSRALLRGSRADLRESGDQKKDATLRADLDAVTTHLGHLALAVDMARAYLTLHPGQTPVTLLAKLRASDAAAISLFEADELKEEAHRYSLSVAKSLALHMDPLAGTPAERLLFAAAFAAPDRIPVDLLRSASGVDEAAADEGLTHLRNKSIVHHQPGPDGGLVSLHRLTQLVARARLAKAGPDGPSRVLAAWFQAIDALHESDDHDEIRPRRTAATVHVTTAADHALLDPTAAVTHRDAANCHRRNAGQYAIIGDFAAAEAAIEKAVRWAEGGGVTAVRVLMIFLAERARIRQARNDLVRAQADIQRSIDWSEIQSPRDEHELTVYYATRADIRRERGDYVGAYEDIQKSIIRGEAHPSQDKQDLAVYYAMRSEIHRVLGDLREAAADLQRSIDIGEAQSPRNERSLAIDYSSRSRIGAAQAIAARKAGDANKAAVLFALAKADIDHALTWFEKNLPGDERTIAILRRDKARIEKAERGVP